MENYYIRRSKWKSQQERIYQWRSNTAWGRNEKPKWIQNNRFLYVERFTRNEHIISTKIFINLQVK